MDKRTAKIVFFGHAEVGKTAILHWLEENQIPKYIPATFEYEEHHFLANDVKVTIFDLGGTTFALERFTSEISEIIFSGVSSFVCVVDSVNIQGIKLLKYYFDLALQRLTHYSPTALVFIFQHKVDLLPRALRAEARQTIYDYLLEGITQTVHYFETSIFDPSLDDALRAVFEATVGSPLTTLSIIEQGNWG